MVSIGVTMELIAQPHAIVEGFRQQIAVEDLRSTNLVQEQEIETLHKENIDGRMMASSLENRATIADSNLAVLNEKTLALHIDMTFRPMRFLRRMRDWLPSGH